MEGCDTLFIESRIIVRTWKWSLTFFFCFQHKSDTRETDWKFVWTTLTDHCFTFCYRIDVIEKERETRCRTISVGNQRQDIHSQRVWYTIERNTIRESCCCNIFICVVFMREREMRLFGIDFFIDLFFVTNKHSWWKLKLSLGAKEDCLQYCWQRTWGVGEIALLPTVDLQSTNCTGLLDSPTVLPY
jgi:hypothetical protein